MKTVDGNKNSAVKILDFLNKRNNDPKKNEHNLFQKIYLKYFIMRIRAKISFTALCHRMTVMEVFVASIIKTY